MAKRALKAHSDSLHSSETSFDQPNIGDVRIEESYARNKDGAVDYDAPRVFRLYVFQKRPTSGEHSNKVHASQFPNKQLPPGFKADKRGNVQDSEGKPAQRFAANEAWLPEGEFKTRAEAETAAAKAPLSLIHVALSGVALNGRAH